MSQFHIPVSEKFENVPGIFGIRLGDQPSYEVISNDGRVEIRYYDPQTLVSIHVKDDEHEAFLRLSHYIFGQNAQKKSIATCPVSMKDESMTSYFMTAPLLHTRSADCWTLSFVLPHSYSITTAPTPLDSDIFLHEKPSHLKAVIRYCEEGPVSSAQELTAWLAASEHYVQLGQIQIAQYDNSKPLTFFRRNEVQIEISEKH